MLAAVNMVLDAKKHIICKEQNDKSMLNFDVLMMKFCSVVLTRVGKFSIVMKIHAPYAVTSSYANDL